MPIAAVQIFAANERMNQILIEHLDPAAWKANPPAGGPFKPGLGLSGAVLSLDASGINLKPEPARHPLQG